MSDMILIEKDGPIAVLTLNNPALRNPISDIEMVDALTAALEDIDRDPAIRCAILAAAGKGFSSGGNMAKLGLPGELGGGPPVETPAGYKQGIQRIPLVFEKLAVPIIAAVHGAAVGAGCDLACMCDIRIAADNALFAESFVKVGLIPGDGGAWLLQRLVGFSKACEMAFTGEPIDAQEALACGLVSKVVPLEDLLPMARELAGRIAANPPHAVQMTKRLLRLARNQRLDEHLESAAACQALAHTTADHREAVSAFRDKRQPQFTGE